MYMDTKHAQNYSSREYFYKLKLIESNMKMSEF